MALARQYTGKRDHDESRWEFYISSFSTETGFRADQIPSIHRRRCGHQVSNVYVLALTGSPLISVLRYIREEQGVRPGTRIIIHYLVRLRGEALFADELSNLKTHFDDLFEGHIWLTRQESPAADPSLLPSHGLIIHNCETSDPGKVGESWEWWNSFSELALSHFDTKEHRQSSLVYICGPQGLTDRLFETYKDHGMDGKDGQLQVEKWW